MTKNKNIKMFVILVLVILLTINMLCIYMYKNHKPLESNGVAWSGKQKIDVDKEINYIAIPGFNQLTFQSKQTNQKVNLYNPPENKCAMSMSMYLSDGTLLWSNDNIQPGHGFYDIEINTVLEKGVYDNCSLDIHCYDFNGTELNGGKMNFTLYVI